MKLVANWRRILRKAWSVRQILLAGVLSGLEVALPCIGDADLIPTGAFAAQNGNEVKLSPMQAQLIMRTWVEVVGEAYVAGKVWRSVTRLLSNLWFLNI